MTGLIIDYIASYRDGHISADKFREDVSNPEVVMQQDLADFIMGAFDRNLLSGLPPIGYYDRIQVQKKPAFIPNHIPHHGR